MEEDAVLLEVCKYMGWDYYTCLAQPAWFLETAIIKMREEGIAKNNRKNHGN